MATISRFFNGSIENKGSKKGSKKGTQKGNSTNKVGI